MNIDFLKDILVTEHEYWIVAIKESVNEYGRMKRVDDSILLIAIPYGIRRGLAYENILLSDVEKLHRVNIDSNIFITGNYPPFQQGITMYNIYAGFPITKNIHQFLIDALALKSCSIWDYKELLNKDQEVKECDTTEAK